MERKSFVFYRSFYDSISKLDEETRLKCYEAIIAYGLNGTEPDSDSVIVNAIVELIKPLIDINNKRYMNGCKGGRPKKNKNADETKAKTKKKQRKAEEIDEQIKVPEQETVPEEVKDERSDPETPEIFFVPVAEQKESEPEEPEQQSDQTEEKEPEKPKEKKNIYGDHGNVRLTDTDLMNMVKKRPKEDIDKAIQILDNYIESLSLGKKKDYIRKNHRQCIYNWVFDRIDEDRAKAAKKTGVIKPFNNFMQNTYDKDYFEKLENTILEN